MTRPLTPPPPGLLWWTDGIHAVLLDAPTISAWLERGVSRGHVVKARDAEHARKLGTKLDKPA